MSIYKQCFKILAVICLGLGSIQAQAKELIAVDKNNCAARRNNLKPFILLLKTGEELHAGIKQCAQDAGLKGASIHGLGQFVNPTFAYYGPNAMPQEITLDGTYELISLNGNIATNKGEYYNHIHAVLGDNSLHASAGHIKKATIGVTAELTITPFSKPLLRDVDPETNFGPIVTKRKVG